MKNPQKNLNSEIQKKKHNYKSETAQSITVTD